MKTSLFLFILFFSFVTQGRKGIDHVSPVPCEYFPPPEPVTRCGTDCMMGKVHCPNQGAPVIGYLNKNETLLKGLEVLVTDRDGENSKEYYIHFHRFSQNNSLADFSGSQAETNMAKALELQGVQLKHGDRIQVVPNGYIFPSSATLYETKMVLGPNQLLNSAVQSAIKKKLTENTEKKIICEYARGYAPMIVYDKGCPNKKICHAQFRCLDTKTDIMFDIETACPAEGEACPREATRCVVNQVSSYKDNGEGVSIK